MTWLGQLPAAELRSHTLAADVCLGVFGRSEKAGRVVPNKVFDALACGRPVVTAASDGAREWLRDGETALLDAGRRSGRSGGRAAPAARRRRARPARPRPDSASTGARSRPPPWPATCSRRWSAV